MKRDPGRLSKCTVLGAFAISTCCLAPSAGAQHKSTSPANTEAERLLAEAQSAAEAARRWFESHLSREALEKSADDATRLVEATFAAALAEARAELRKSLGVFVLTPGGDPADRSAWLRPAEFGAPVPGRVVVLVHGLDEFGAIWDDAAPALREAGHTVARFNYANDQAASRSAEDLASALRELRAEGVERVSIIGHSLGGLVARDVLTRPGIYGGRMSGVEGLPAVDRLITLGAPNHGSPLAPHRSVMEVRDQFMRWVASEGTNASALVSFMADGTGEAGVDLAPGSPYLADLNARPLPEGLPITLIVGDIGAAERAELRQALDASWVRSLLGEEELSALKEKLSSVAADIGDGCVPRTSALLPGVTDVVRVDADHRSMIRRLPAVEAVRGLWGHGNETPPGIPIILDRLGRDEP